MTHRPEASPNFLVIVYDDLGFADFGCYGSTIDTPTADGLASTGVRFTNFTVTPLCSPTRAALLTGRNPHRVGMGSIVQFANDQPGYTGRIPMSARMLPDILRRSGYGTFAVGKWHLTLPHESGPAGPFDSWPLGQGFERFYGFLPGKTDHWRPEITRDNHVLGPPDGGPSYHLTSDLADQMITYIADHAAGRPDDPFFGYMSLGAVHSPHHSPDDFIRRYRGAFEKGWDSDRKRRFDRQVELGMFEDGTPLAEPNPTVPKWDELPPEDQETAARFMEAYAGFLTHADREVGRVLAFLDQTDLLGNTVVVMLSDNGATDAGGDEGVLNEERILNRLPETRSDRAAMADDIGSRATLNQYPSGWGQASNTPFRWFKHTVHNGGVRCPLIISWGAMRGEARLAKDHVNVTDIAPTLLDIAGVEPPSEIDGIAQLEFDGTSFHQALINREAFKRPTPQHFEVRGHRALIDSQWKAVARHHPGESFGDDQWELYDTDMDPAETEDLSSIHPERLDRMIATWWQQAEANGVLPMLDGGVERLLDPENLKPNNRSWTFRPTMTPVPAEAGPHLAGKSFQLVAEITASERDQGVIFASGGSFGGFSLYMQDGSLFFHQNAAGTHASVSIRLDPNTEVRDVTAGLTVETTGGARLYMAVNGEPAATVTATELLPIRAGVETIQCGRDLGSAVSPSYSTPFTFTGEIERVRLALT